MPTITIHAGDMLDQEVDVLVNAVSTDLILGASALEEAISGEGNEDILQAFYSAAPVSVGDIVVTGKGTLHVQHVFHAVVMSELTPPTDSSVGRCVTNTLLKAEALHAKTVAMPPLGSRVCHYTMEEAATAALRAARAYLAAHPESALEEVRFVVPYDTDLPVWTEAEARLNAPVSDTVPQPS